MFAATTCQNLEFSTFTPEHGLFPVPVSAQAQQRWRWGWRSAAEASLHPSEVLLGSCAARAPSPAQASQSQEPSVQGRWPEVSVHITHCSVDPSASGAGKPLQAQLLLNCKEDMMAANKI